MDSLEELTRAVADLLGQIGLSGQHTFAPLPGGANNRVYRVQADGRTLFLKHHYPHPDDARDRFGHEWAFATFAWRHGLRTIAEPLAADATSRLALFEFVPGERLAPFEVTEDHVLQAARFFRDLNRYRQHPDAHAIPVAEEACFRLVDHLDLIERRVRQLDHIELKSPGCEMAADFVATELRPAWNQVRGEIERSTSATECESPLPQTERCLSPSDFGIHNTLVRQDGSLLFHDFEFAGKDDPAKMVCDFFRQMQSPPPIAWARSFIETALSEFAPGAALEALRRRIALLWPAYRVKWSCVVLNDFLPVAEARQTHAGQPPSEMRRRRQLEMARDVLANSAPIPV